MDEKKNVSMPYLCASCYISADKAFIKQIVENMSLNISFHSLTHINIQKNNNNEMISQTSSLEHHDMTNNRKMNTKT